jgi:signal transduction histidine kinase
MKFERYLQPGVESRSARVAGGLLRYVWAVLSVALAALARLSLDSFLGQDVLPYSFFYLAVAVTAWWAGWRPALAASLGGLLVGIWLIVPPRHSFFVHGLPAFMEIVVYLFVTGIVIGLMTSLRKARGQAQANAAVAVEKRRELEREVERRKLTEDALRRSEAFLEQRIKERTAELEETVGELKRFSYAIIHDMRAPLRSMSGFAEILEEESGAGLPSSSREYLRRMRAACHRMDRLIQDSLNYNKVLLKSIPLQPVDLSKLLRELCATYPNLQPFQERIHLEGILPIVMGNDAALTQCFSILLDNAVKFIAPGMRPEISIWADRTEGRAKISVKDNGIGIPAATQRHLFGVFQRHDATQEGNGIGLAIVGKLVQRMGGRVGVESEPGKGSRFWIELNPAPGQGQTFEGNLSNHSDASAEEALRA